MLVGGGAIAFVAVGGTTVDKVVGTLDPLDEPGETAGLTEAAAVELGGICVPELDAVADPEADPDVGTTIDGDDEADRVPPGTDVGGMAPEVVVGADRGGVPTTELILEVLIETPGSEVV